MCLYLKGSGRRFDHASRVVDVLNCTNYRTIAGEVSPLVRELHSFPSYGARRLGTCEALPEPPWPKIRTLSYTWRRRDPSGPLPYKESYTYCTRGYFLLVTSARSTSRQCRLSYKIVRDKGSSG